MLHLPEVFFRKLRSFFSLSKLLTRLLGFRSTPKDKRKKGVILIQIDALSRKQFEAAIKKGRMPFLKKLLTNEHYRLHTHYAGMPCCTPAVQAELFYGKKCTVPTFSFYDPKTKRVFRMFTPDDALEIEKRLDKNVVSLLAGGSSYSNIYTGGANESHFCVSDLHFIPIFKRMRPLGFILAVILNLPSLIRAGILFAIELCLSVIDVFRGVYEGKNLWKEIKFIPSRVGLSVLMREIIVMCVRTDIHRGLEIIQLNLMGYHEQSHHRGASSKFAHWSLKGIDSAIKRIWKAAHQSPDDYDVWIYSDHGQADCTSYDKEFGESFDHTVSIVAEQEKSKPHTSHNHVSFLNRLGIFTDKIKPNLADKNRSVITTAMGPLAQVYLLTDNDEQKRNEFAEKLFNTDKIPLVLVPQKDGTVNAISQTQGRFILPDQADLIFSRELPFFESLVSDFMKVCNHKYSGEILCSGFKGFGKEVMTFRLENGCHGGVSEEEFSGLFMAPANRCIQHTLKGYLRPINIRNEALRLLNRHCDNSDIGLWPRDETDTIRIMTYNTHTCRGMDGRLSPIRIAKTIEQYNPDIVALQELDIDRKRTRNYDQARIIAEILEMDHFFLPAIEIEEEKYGDAILSRFPMRLIKSDLLPEDSKYPIKEPRGAIWVEIDVQGKKLNVINTHLGLTARERERQIAHLLGDQWLGAVPEGDEVILCGDFNFTKRSKLYKLCTEKLNEAGQHSRPAATYGGRYPLLRLDHIFFSKNIKIKSTLTANSALAKIASDHRPLISEFYY